MKRPINKQLTRQMLEDMGICHVDGDERTNNGWIDRYWYKNKSKTIKEHTRVKITYAICKHKYTFDKSYPKINFNYKGKGVCYPLARFIYAGFYGEVKEGEVVDHIDNNPFNNNIENLQVLTQEQNLHKRYKDNPNYNRNQGDVINGR